MEIKSSVRLLTYFTKLVLGDTKGILPFPVAVQKPVPSAQRGVPLPRCTPDEARIPAGALDAFYRALASGATVGAHGALVLRGGKVACEGFFAPYRPDCWQVTHSLAKSFTGTAIGMLIDEGKLSRTERVCDIFPDKCSILTSRRARAITVDDLLTMRSGANFREVGCVTDKDWAAAFLASDILFEPGTQFDYNSMNTYMLSAIVTRRAGQSLYAYLTPRLFRPLGFGSVAWETCPLGVNKGGWGMYVQPEDIAKLGLLYLQKGMWTADGVQRRLLSEEWVALSTSTVAKSKNGEEYGRQIWTREADHAFMFNGMFGQYMVASPELDMIIVITAGSNNLFTDGPSYLAVNALLDAVRKADAAGFASSRADARALRFTLEHLRFGEAVPRPARFAALARFAHMREEKASAARLAQQCAALDKKCWEFQANRLSALPVVLSVMNDYYTDGLARLGFTWQNETLTLHWGEGNTPPALRVGFAQAVENEANFGGNVFRVGVRGQFTKNEDDVPVLKLTLNYIESTSTQQVKLFFLKDGLRVALDELPSLRYTMHLIEGTMPASGAHMNVGILKDADYLAYRVERIMQPCAMGAPVSAEEETRGKGGA